MKTCTRCDTSKELDQFFKNRSRPDGLSYWCKTCTVEDSTPRVARWKKANTTKAKLLEARYRNSHRDVVRTRARNWARKNMNQILERQKLWRDKNPGVAAFRSLLQHKKRSLRVPIWTDLIAIEKFYRACPKGYEVDHIIPLCGKTVSGLHVLSNLQYLTKEQNREKHNNYP